MEEKNVIKNFLAGMFFILGLILIFLVILTIGREKGFTKSKFKIEVLYRNVGGLMEGAPVLLAGVNVGNVSEIDFLDKSVKGRKVKVTLEIFDKFKKQLRKSANFAVKTEGILGEKLIEINIDENAATTDLTKPIIGEDAVDMQDLAKVFATAAESLTKTSEELSKIDIVDVAKGMGETTEALRKSSEGIDQMVLDMHDIVIKAKRILNRLEQKVIEGNLFKVF